MWPWDPVVLLHISPPEGAGWMEGWSSLWEVLPRCQLGDDILLGWSIVLQDVLYTLNP